MIGVLSRSEQSGCIRSPLSDTHRHWMDSHTCVHTYTHIHTYNFSLSQLYNLSVSHSSMMDTRSPNQSSAIIWSHSKWFSKLCVCKTKTWRWKAGVKLQVAALQYASEPLCFFSVLELFFVAFFWHQSPSAIKVGFHSSSRCCSSFASLLRALTLVLDWTRSGFLRF